MSGNLKNFRMVLAFLCLLIVETISAQTIYGNVVDNIGNPFIGITPKFP